MKKKTLREQGIIYLKSISQSQRASLSKRITDHVLHTSWFQGASVIGVTVSKAFELDTTYLIHKAWENEKQVVVPKCFPERDHEMKFYRLTSFDQLERVYAGILEPVAAKTEQVSKHQIDLLIVPGIWFDRKGYRVGFGGGYFDRYLKDFNSVTLSLSTNRQILNEIPKDKYDIPVQHVITEEGIVF
ncbi:5-formyltetrahydrofolate cyclo-ligase [Salinibacillus kushneri]|uniref:5-formyltetrahydrofolate cyclo-ligase n=1 Tax=Salinibacillus kushneri TaxID=237682 RepID=A0A1I0FVW7_9BACI|nr:5-formyltetrahydrofolate cyclo-ligase [Salinibacillus kushneri]SET62674.1 5-formyltetrahydrofolate cyclo-ligase [Salinibacillus kushneri]